MSVMGSLLNMSSTVKHTYVLSICKNCKNLCLSLHRHPTQIVSRSRHDDGTSNFKRHVERCASVDDAEHAGQLSMRMFASGSTYSEPQLRLLIVEWCACNSRPMLIVDDEPFQKMLRMLHAHVAIPSRHTVSRDIKAVFKISQAHVIKFLADTPGRKHKMLDGWSSPNVLSILGSVITFLRGDEMQTIVLDCYR